MADEINLGSLVADVQINMADTEMDLAIVKNLLKDTGAEIYKFAEKADDASKSTYDLAGGLEKVSAAQTQVVTSARAAGSAIESGAAAGTRNLNGLNTAVRNLGYGLSDVFSNNGPLGQKVQGFANNVGNISTGVLSMLGKTGPGAAAAAAGLEIAFTVAGAAMTAFGVKSVGDLVNLFAGGVKEIEDDLRGLQERVKDLENNPVRLAVETLELDNARAKIEGIKSALAALKSASKLQGSEAKEAGKAATEGISEAPGGGEAVTAKVRAQVASELERTDPALKAARAEQDKIAAALKEMEASPHRTAEGVAYLSKQLEKAEEAARKAMIAITGEGGSADVATGELFAAARNGSGEKQKRAKEKIAGIVGGRAGDVIAGREMSEADRVKSEDAEMKAVHEAGINASKPTGLSRGEDYDMEQGQKEQKRREKQAEEEYDAGETQLQESIKAQHDGNEAIKKRKQEAVKKAKDVVPDLDQLVDAAAVKTAIVGGKLDKAAMAKEPMNAPGSKLSQKEAEDAVEESLKGVNGRINKKMRGEIDRAEAEPRRNSETLDTAGLTGRVQSAVHSGGDEAKKHTTQNYQIIKHLASIAQRKGVNIQVTD